jgi:hypothetical protein
MNLNAGAWVIVRLPFYTKAKIHTMYADGSIGLEINGNKLYSVRAKHVVKVVEGIRSA